MDEKLKKDFLTKWSVYFNGARLPLVFFYSDKEPYAEFLGKMSPRRGAPTHCMIGLIRGAEKGKTIVFSKETMGCPGGGRYSGFTRGFRPKFNYFLSCGIPGEMEGERYKKIEDMDESFLTTPTWARILKRIKPE